MALSATRGAGALRHLVVAVCVGGVGLTGCVAIFTHSHTGP